jgi:hypothetical protein
VGLLASWGWGSFKSTNRRNKGEIFLDGKLVRAIAVLGQSKGKNR